MTADSPGASPINAPSQASLTRLRVTRCSPRWTTLCPTASTCQRAVLKQVLTRPWPGHYRAHSESGLWLFAAMESGPGARSRCKLHGRRGLCRIQGTHLLLSLTYTGTGLNLNQLPDSYDSLGPSLLAQVSNPFYGILLAGTTMGAPTVAEGYLLLPHPQYPGGLTQAVPRDGNSTYHALQATYIRHFGHAGTLQALTPGESCSATPKHQRLRRRSGRIAVIQDNYNLRAEKAISEEDIANNLVINYGLDLPFGNEERFSRTRMARRTASLAAGGQRYYEVSERFASCVDCGGKWAQPVWRWRHPANYTPGCTKPEAGPPHSAARANEWFNTACFTQPENFAFGNEPRVDPALKSEGEANFDISINKFFSLTEHARLKFSTEIFNLFNHAQFAEPNVNMSSPGFGQVETQRNLPRTIQFAARITF